MKFILDIQTTSAPGVEDSFYLNWAMKRGSRSSEEALRKAGMHAEFGFICGVALLPVDVHGVPDESRLVTFTAKDPKEEDVLLSKLREYLQDPSSIIIGHNVKCFDIPYLTKRFLAHQYIIPEALQRAIYNDQYVDVMQILACNGGSLMSLRATAYMLGIEDPLSDVDQQKSVYELHASGNLARIAEIGRINVRVTWQVYTTLVESKLIKG